MGLRSKGRLMEDKELDFETRLDLLQIELDEIAVIIKEIEAKAKAIGQLFGSEK